MTRPLLLLLALLVAPLPAAVVPLSPKKLQEKAAYVVTATVDQTYASISKDKRYETTNTVAEIKIGKVLKGGGLKPGQVIYVHYWKRRWIAKGRPEPGTNGHHRGTKKGERIRVHLTKVNGRFEVLFPNGIVEEKAGDA